MRREDFSPEQVVGWFARYKILAISHETIDRHIWLDMKRGATLHVHLRRANKPFRKRYGAYDRRGRLAGKRHISTRSAGAPSIAHAWATLRSTPSSGTVRAARASSRRSSARSATW